MGGERTVTRGRRWQGRTERGTYIISFLLTLPLLVVAVSGLLTLGTALTRWIDLSHAAQIGVRQLAVYGRPTPATMTAVDRYLEAAGITPAAVTVNWWEPTSTWGAAAPTVPAAYGDIVGIRLTTTVPLWFWGWQQGPPHVTITAGAVTPSRYLVSGVGGLNGNGP